MELPAPILDDRNAFVGMTGSGKSTAAAGMVEMLLEKNFRVCIVDPTGVWWGLRTLADGKRPGYPIVVFGGKHGDLPLNDRSGEVIAQAIASGDFSCVLDLSELGTRAAERKFMQPFAEVIFAKNTRPLHLVLDEADQFVPQKPIEPQAQILGSRIDHIVRRGRVKGFTPWLLTQRPAVISKDVLSQMDTLIALKLTSSQDRSALDAWIEGQADKAEQKRIYGLLPRLQVGDSVLWSPSHGVLTEFHFPLPKTFDSRRTPKRGEKLKAPTDRAPVDLEALRNQLSAATAEAEANDPAKLRQRIKELETANKGLSNLKATVAAPDPAAIEKARVKGDEEGYRRGYGEGLQKARDIMAQALLQTETIAPPWVDISNLRRLAHQARTPYTMLPPVVAKSDRKIAIEVVNDTLPRSRQRILDVLRWLQLGNIDRPNKLQVALLSNQSPTSSGFTNNLGALRTAGLIDYPMPGLVALTEAGRMKAREPDRPPLVIDLHNALERHLPASRWRIVEELIKAYPEAYSKEELAKAVNQSFTSSGYTNNLGALRSLGFIDYPSPGMAVALPVLFLGE